MEVSLRDVLKEVAHAIPSEIHPNIIIIGGLAAEYLRRPRDMDSDMGESATRVLSIQREKPRRHGWRRAEEVTEKTGGLGGSHLPLCQRPPLPAAADKS